MKDVTHIILVLIALWLVLSQCTRERVRTEWRIDTVTKVIEHEPVSIRARATHVRDTVWLAGDSTSTDTAGFVATLDTIHHGDTIQVSYQHPRAAFAIDIRRAPDTVQVVTVPQIIRESDPWWYDVAKIGGGILAGYAIGRAR